MKPEGYREAIFKEKTVEDPPRRTPMIVTVDRSTLLAAIRDAGIDIPKQASAISVTFRVPGGGDYSSCDVELDDNEQVISVRYER